MVTGEGWQSIDLLHISVISCKHLRLQQQQQPTVTSNTWILAGPSKVHRHVYMENKRPNSFPMQCLSYCAHTVTNSGQKLQPYLKLSRHVPIYVSTSSATVQQTTLQLDAFALGLVGMQLTKDWVQEESQRCTVPLLWRVYLYRYLFVGGIATNPCWQPAISIPPADSWMPKFAFCSKKKLTIFCTLS